MNWNLAWLRAQDPHAAIQFCEIEREAKISRTTLERMRDTYKDAKGNPLLVVCKNNPAMTTPFNLLAAIDRRMAGRKKYARIKPESIGLNTQI